MKELFLIIITILSIHNFSTNAQNCAEKKIQFGLCKEPFDLSYEETGKSLSFPVYSGKTQKIVVTLAGKKDYYLAVCAENGEELSFKIKNANNPDEVVFDNSGFDKPQTIEFSLLFTSKILFEITLPMIMGQDNKNAVCIGLLLYQKDN